MKFLVCTCHLIMKVASPRLMQHRCAALGIVFCWVWCRLSTFQRCFLIPSHRHRHRCWLHELFAQLDTELRCCFHSRKGMESQLTVQWGRSPVNCYYQRGQIETKVALANVNFAADVLVRLSVIYGGFSAEVAGLEAQSVLKIGK